MLFVEKHPPDPPVIILFELKEKIFTIELYLFLCDD